MRAVFITGTDTGVGKTVVSALLAKALDADYWKPVQCGLDRPTDSDTMAALAPGVRIHPEAYRLRLPASPHAAAAAEGVRVELESVRLPPSEKTLVVEGAGGVMVPLNGEALFVDWVEERALPVVLVSLNRLGSINHTLLSVEALMARRLEILGLIFNGEPVPATEEFLLDYTGLPLLGRVPRLEHPEAAALDRLAPSFAASWGELAGT